MSPLLWALDPGYTSDITQERERDYKEVPFLDPVLPLAHEPEPPSLVNKKLSLDFQDRYERQFGHRQEEVSVFETQRATTVINSRGEMPSGQETTEAQLQFGHYMIRRLGEYHLDNYLKEDPKARVIYEAKENLSKARVSVSSNVKFHLRYSLSSNDIELKVDNPWLDFQARTDVGGGSSAETTIRVGQKLDSYSYLETQQQLASEKNIVRWTRKLSQRLETGLHLTGYWLSDARNEEESSLWSIWTWRY